MKITAPATLDTDDPAVRAALLAAGWAEAGPPPPPPAPVIEAFAADFPEVFAGQTVTLSWSVTGAGAVVTLASEYGGPTFPPGPGSASYPLTHPGPETFTLTARNAGGEASRSLTVLVRPVPPPPPVTPPVTPPVVPPAPPDVAPRRPVPRPPWLPDIPAALTAGALARYLNLERANYESTRWRHPEDAAFIASLPPDSGERVIPVVPPLDLDRPPNPPVIPPDVPPTAAPAADYAGRYAQLIALGYTDDQLRSWGVDKP